MEATPDTHSTQLDRIKLPFTFDPDKMLEEFNALQRNPFEYYDVVMLHSPAHLVDSSIPMPPPADDYADGSWCDWMNTPEMEQSPYLTSVVDFFKQHTKVTLVRLLRLAPGSVVNEHTDPTLALEIERSVIRLTIPIYKGEGVEFYLNNSLVPMEPGECWYLRLIDPHRVLNNGGDQRVNLTIDMIPNQWVVDTILKHDQPAN